MRNRNDYYTFLRIYRSFLFQSTRNQVTVFHQDTLKRKIPFVMFDFTEGILFYKRKPYDSDPVEHS